MRSEALLISNSTCIYRGHLHQINAMIISFPPLLFSPPSLLWLDQLISTLPIFFSFLAIAIMSISPTTVSFCSLKSAAIESTPVYQQTIGHSAK